MLISQVSNWDSVFVNENFDCFGWLRWGEWKLSFQITWHVSRNICKIAFNIEQYLSPAHLESIMPGRAWGSLILLPVASGLLPSAAGRLCLCLKVWLTAGSFPQGDGYSCALLCAQSAASGMCHWASSTC